MTLSIRTALERLVHLEGRKGPASAIANAWTDAIADARAALRAETGKETSVTQAPSLADVRQLCVDNEIAMFVDSNDFDTVVVAILEIVRTAFARRVALPPRSQGVDQWYPDFANWLEGEMSEGTVIGDPLWWASKIASYFCRPAPTTKTKKP